MHIRTCSQITSIRGSRIVMRCDFNVVVKKKKVEHDYKIIRTLPTIRYLLGKGAARIVITSHLGRPQGKRLPSASLAPVAAHLETALGKKVTFVGNASLQEARAAVDALPDGSVVVLENVRFDPREKQNDAEFARELASFGDIFVNDALAVSHRAHASVARIQQFLPSYAGLLLEKELNAFAALNKPPRPFVVIMGGAKLATKVSAIKALAKKADYVLIGGMLAYPLAAARGLSTGRYEPAAEEVRLAHKLRAHNIILPVDYVTARRKDGAGKTRVVAAEDLPGNAYQFDVGPQTIREYSHYIKSAHAVLWNGPMGMFEKKPYRHGTLGVARLLGSLHYQATTIAGGGETIAALEQAQALEYVNWASTGGGAMLTYFAGEAMPGLKKIVRRW